MEFTALTAGSTSTSTGAAYIAFTNGTTSLTNNAGQNGFYNTINNCTMTTTSSSSPGPMHGIYSTQSSGSYSGTSSNNTFSNNKILNFYYYAYYSYYTNGDQFLNNEITRKGTTFYYYMYTIWQYYGYSSTRSTMISGNYVHDLPTSNYYPGNYQCYYTYGIYSVYLYGSTNYRAKIERNRLVNLRCDYYSYNVFTNYATNVDITSNLVKSPICMYGVYGVLTQYPNNSRIEGNTIYSDVANTSYPYCYEYLLYEYASSSTNGSTVRGNMVASPSNNYYKYMHYCYGLTYFGSVDNNNYYQSGSSSYPLNWYTENGSFTVFSDWKSQAKMGQGETYLNPKFINAGTGDFRSNNFALNNAVVNSGSTALDNNNVARNMTVHDVGALENFTDVEITGSTYNGGSNVCGGYEEKLSITYKNNFIDSSFNVKVAFKLNNTKVTEIIPNKVAPGASITYTFKTPVVFHQPGLNTLDIMVDIPDDNISNDVNSRTVNVTPSPDGSMFTFVPQTIKNAPLDLPNFDVTLANKTLKYSVNSPKKYTNNDHGTKWNVTASGTYMNGTPFSSSMFSWTAPSGSVDGVLNFTPNQALTDSFVWVYLKIKDALCDTTIRTKVFVAPLTKTNFSFPQPVCNGEGVIFNNLSTISSGAFDAMWVFGDGDTTYGINPVHTYPTYGTFNCKLVTSTLPYGFLKDTTISLVINDVPTVNFTKTNSCEGQNVVFKNTTTLNTPGTLIYKWTFGDGGSSTIKDPSHLYATPGAYSVTLSASSNGCAKSITKIAYQFAKPKPSFTVTNNKCENEPFTFTNTSTISDGQMGHYWFLDDNDEISTEKDLIFMYTSPGTKSVKLRCVSEFGCTDSVVKNVTVLDAPNATFTHSDACSVDPTKFNNNTVGISNPGTIWAWDFGDGTNSSVLSPSHNWTSLGSKNVSLKVAFSNGCVDEEVQTLAVGIQPVAAFNVTDVCAGKPAVFVNNTTWPQGDISYSWDFGDLTSSTLSDPTHVYSTSATTSYNVTLITSIAGGCKDTVTNTFNVNENPKTCDFKWEYDWTVGTPGIKFTPTGPGQPNAQAGVNYTWVLDKEGTYTSTMNPITHDFIQLRELTIQMSAINATGCKCSISKTLNASTGIKSDVWGAEISMYPNPTQGRFVINASKLNLKSLKVEVSNMEGKIVKEVNGTLQNGTIELDGSDLANGIYMVKITGNNTSTIKRISINH